MSKIWIVFVILFFGMMLPKLALAFDTATIEQVEEFGLAITSGYRHSCALTKAGVTCWGDNSLGQINVPELSHPRQLSAGDVSTCALDDFGVKCWGAKDWKVNDVPQLNHPRQISTGGGFACALDDSGVKCWGHGADDDVKFKVPSLVHPRQISAGGGQICALDDSGVKCWGIDSSILRYVPRLSHPRQISLGLDNICALDDSGVKCWGAESYNVGYGRVNDVPLLSHPRWISVGSSACALDDSGVKCWGYPDLRDRLNKLPLCHPKLVSAGYRNVCTLDDSGVTCWGDEKQENVPRFRAMPTPFDLFLLETSYTNLSTTVYHDKKILLQNLAKTVEKFPVSRADDLSIPSENGMSRFLSMYLLEILLQETRSDYIEIEVLPKLRQSTAEWGKKFDLSRIQDVALSVSGLEVVSTLVESGLQASKTYLSSAEQQELEDLMLSVAQAKSLNESSLAQSASQLLAALDQHQSLLAKSLESERTIGFGKMILEIQSYLKGHAL